MAVAKLVNKCRGILDKITFPTTESFALASIWAGVKVCAKLYIGWPAKFREMFREIFISHFAKFSNDFRGISRNFAKQNILKFHEISRK